MHSTLTKWTTFLATLALSTLGFSNENQTALSDDSKVESFIESMKEKTTELKEIAKEKAAELKEDGANVLEKIQNTQQEEQVSTPEITFVAPAPAPVEIQQPAKKNKKSSHRKAEITRHKKK